MKPAAARLVCPEGIDANRLEAIAQGAFLTQRLIDTPTAEMGPAELEAEARALAEAHGADCTVTTGDALLDANFPMIHTVGRAAAAAPASSTSLGAIPAIRRSHSWARASASTRAG